LSLVNFECVKILIEKHQQDGVKWFRNVYGTQALAGLAVGQNAAASYLELAISSGCMFNRIVSGLTGGRKLNPEYSGGFIFGNLTGDPERFAGKRMVFLRELFGFTI